MSRKEELFGKLCRDKITGFEGVCTGRTEWIYGCDQYCLTPRVQDDKTKLNDGQWFDDGRLEVIEEVIKPKDVKKKKNGGVHDRSCYPSMNRL